MATPIDARAKWEHAAAHLRQHIPDLLAVIGHGAAGRGETLAGAPIELVAVVHIAPGTPDRNTLELQVRTASGADRLELTVVEAHRLGWLRPSVLQQSLVAGGTLVWGDAAALRVIPSWRPDQLDPRLALDELVGAERDLGEGWPAMAVQRAAGALLIARRRYEPRFDRRVAALQKWWPEAPTLPALGSDASPARISYVSRARGLVEEWLFTWEGAGPRAHAMTRYQAMWRASRATVPA